MPPLAQLTKTQPARDVSNRLADAMTLLERAHEAVMIYARPSDGSQASIVFANAGFARLTGSERDDHIGCVPFHIAQGAAAEGDVEAACLYRRRDGSAVSIDMVLVPLEDPSDGVSHVVAFCRDAAEVETAQVLRMRIETAAKRNAALRKDLRSHKRAENALLHATCRDALTGLPNRLLFLELVKDALRDSRRTGKPVAILFLDCDRFKLVNDTFGHLVGDLLLVEVAARIKDCLRSTDILARIGGDEFAMAITESELSIATNIAHRIAKSFTAPFVFDDNELYLTASVGIALSGSGEESSEDLVRNADIAMYRAKELGKQRCEVYSVELRDRLMRRRLLDAELRRALERSELSVAYQPVVRLSDGTLEGFEALIRWEHAELGAISPQELIAVAEESRLIIGVGDWMLRESCAAMSRWRAIPGGESLSVSVNVSVKQLIDEHFTRRVSNALMQSGLRAERLHLEITESSLMLDTKLASEILTELSEIGVQSHVDDFGTGYSSLTYLQRFPVSTLKIDRSFVSGTDDHIANPAIVRTVISLAKHLGLRVVAEGVETHAQERQLRALGCTFGQGFLFAKPLPANAVPAFIASYRHAPEQSA